MGFFRDIELQYGFDAMNKLKTYASTNMKLAKFNNRRTFLLRCRNNKVFPKHIEHAIKNISMLTSGITGRRNQYKVLRFNQTLRIKILNLEIGVTHDTIHFFKKRITELKLTITNILPYQISTEFYKRQSLKYWRIFDKIKTTNVRKYNALVGLQKERLVTPENWLKNLSTTEIPQDVKLFLSLGPKFSIEPSKKDLKVPVLLADIDLLATQFPENSRNRLLCQVVNTITNYMLSPKSQPSIFRELFSKTRKFLKDHPDLLIINSDKMNVTTILNKNQYHTLAINHLNDTTYYKIISRDPTSTTQQKANKIVTELEKKKMISKEDARKYKVNNGVIGKFYGQPKIHKPTLQLRPIISTINGPNRGIARMITEILTKSYNSDNPYYVADSFEFSRFINNYKLPSGYILISLDVTSLFTNISTQLACNSIEKRWLTIQQQCKIPKDKFLSIIQFIFNTTAFIFQGTYYQQIMGMPMGSSASPILAQYVMDDFLDSCLPTLPFEVPFLKKYVDDIIMAVPTNQTQQVLHIFNNHQPLLQFTIEEEVDGRIPFLDTYLHRDNNNTIRTSWYTRPGNSGRYIHWESYHAYKHKIGLIITMTDRIRKLSHPQYVNEDLHHLRDILLNNGYPRHILNKILFESTTLDTNIPNNNQDQRHLVTRYFSIPYHQRLSPKISKIISQYNEDIKVSWRYTLTGKTIYPRLKDPIPVKQQSNVVYSIPCKDCSAQYVGQTSRLLNDRLTAHKSDIRLNKQSCMLSVHSNNNDHSPDYDNTTVLEVESNHHKRCFLEMVHIMKDDRNINSRTDIDGMNIIYSFLLDLDHPRIS